MAVFSSATINRFESTGEQDFIQTRPCIIDRVSLEIIAGTAKYTLPSSVTNIRRVTWLGWKLYPLPHRDLRQSYLSGTQQSTPYWYVFNNIGQAQIQLFPVPNISISAGSGNNLYGSEIINRVIVEFYRTPDQLAFKIPAFFRRQLLKCYINKKCFAMDTKAQNMKAANYWAAKYDWLCHVYTELMDDLNNKSRNLIAGNTSQRPYGFMPPPPLLPINRYGISVDEPGW